MSTTLQFPGNRLNSQTDQYATPTVLNNSSVSVVQILVRGAEAITQGDLRRKGQYFGE